MARQPRCGVIGVVTATLRRSRCEWQSLRRAAGFCPGSRGDFGDLAGVHPRQAREHVAQVARRVDPQSTAALHDGVEDRSALACAMGVAPAVRCSGVGSALRPPKGSRKKNAAQSERFQLVSPPSKSRFFTLPLSFRGRGFWIGVLRFQVVERGLEFSRPAFASGSGVFARTAIP